MKEADYYQQPKDPNHELYRLVDETLEHGDIKEIAADLHAQPATVSNVKCGRIRSRRIWSAIIKKALQRKKDQDEIAKILSSKPKPCMKCHAS